MPKEKQIKSKKLKKKNPVNWLKKEVKMLLTAVDLQLNSQPKSKSGIDLDWDLIVKTINKVDKGSLECQTKWLVEIKKIQDGELIFFVRDWAS